MNIISLLKYVRSGFRYLRKRPKGWLNVSINQLFAFLRIPYAPMLPVAATIEPINICNLRCEVCETGSGILKRNKGRIRLSEFQIIIDKIKSHTFQILLYYMGESFLNPDIYEMIKYAKKNDIWIELCTNGDIVDPKKLAASDPNLVSFNIGGLSQETHSTYRGGGNLEKSLDNAKKTIELRDLSKGQMKIILGLIVMKHNEKQVKELPALAKKLGVDGYNPMSPCVRSYEQGLKYLPDGQDWWIYDRDIFENEKKIVPKNIGPCHWIWHSFVVLWNGDVVPCCRDVDGKYIMGNILDQDLKEIWNSKKYVDFRRMVTRERADVDICQLCEGYSPPALYKLN